MYGFTVRSVIALAAFCVLNPEVAAAPVIGMARANGGFLLNGSPVAGHATLFEGATLETEGASSELRLGEGARVVLARDSRGRVHRDRLVLEKGLGEVERGQGYHIEARGLRIAGDSPEASARVALSGERHVQVAALRGTFRVTTAAGRLVAVMTPGKALEFLPQEPGRQPSFTITGCLERRDGHFVVRDLISGVVEELRGAGLERHVGYVVEITATELSDVKPATEAEEVILVQQLRRMRRGCPLPPSKPAPATPSEPAPAPAPAPPVQPGMSGATKAIIAGVVIGGAGAGAAIYLTRKDEEPSTISP